MPTNLIINDCKKVFLPSRELAVGETPFKIDVSVKRRLREWSGGIVAVNKLANRANGPAKRGRYKDLARYAVD